MDLRERLLRVGLPRPDMIEPDRPAHDAPLEALLDGYWAHAASARCFVVEHSYPLEYVHGGQALAQAHAAPREAWAPFLGESDSLRFDACRAVLLDIETTGLARGAGTFAFMVGVGLFDGNRLIVRQYFAPDYADEEALLDLLARDLELASGLITFNGRSFDWPILETRYTLVHRSPPAEGAPHLDLLAVARSLWRRRLVSCALGALEQRVLGIMREQQDVPGYLIPQIYQDYLRWGDTQPLAGVFYHNQMDILAMVSLMARAGQILGAPFERENDPLCDHLALGLLYERRSRPEEAVHAYRLAAACSSDADEISLACQRLANLLKRQGDYLGAVEIWRAQAGGGAVYPYIELAKHLEHRARDYAEARRIILDALVWLQEHERALQRGESRRIKDDLERRLVRVERRLAQS